VTKNKDEFVSQDNELLEVFNQTCERGDFDITSITVSGGIVNMSDGTHKYFIGTERKEPGIPTKYKVDKEALWEQVLRIVHRRTCKSKNGLLNIRTICNQIIEECTITSIKIVENNTIPMFKERFGISDPWEDKEYNGYKGLRGTIQWWGTIGGESNPGRRVKRLYSIINATKLIEYIEGEIDVGKYKNEHGNK